jgi:hypothetical protein
MGFPLSSEEVAFRSPLPLRERDRERGNKELTNLFIQLKIAVMELEFSLPLTCHKRMI